MRRNDFFKSLLFSGGNPASRAELETETLPYIFKSNSHRLRNYRIYGNTVNGESVGDLVTEGEHIGKYCVPVTITNGSDTQTANIYLTEQIRKIGNEFEYIDYNEQKQHRLRKNLLKYTATSQTINGVTFTVNADGSVTCNGTANGNAVFRMLKNPLFDSLPVILSGCPAYSTYYSLQYSNYTDYAYIDKGSEVTINNMFDYTKYNNCYIQIYIYSGYTCNNLTFYPMIRKASVEDNRYEPYIEETDLDISLPTLSTLSGTNSLSTGTEVPPSSIDIKRRKK